MKVFRVEHKVSRNGPFNGEDYVASWGRVRYANWENPLGCHTPWSQDPDATIMDVAFDTLPPGKRVTYGCESIEDLKIWFDPDEWAELVEMGYHVVSYQVRMVAILSTQCAWVYDRRRAKTVVEGGVYGDS